jgi:hypothetical protein
MFSSPATGLTLPATASLLVRVAKQRLERAVTVRGPVSDAAASGGSTHDRLNSPAAAKAATPGKPSPEADQRQLVPFVDVVVQHLKGINNVAGQGSSSSSSGSTRGRGAKRAAARSLLEAHTDVFQAALDLELQEEWQEAEDRLQVGSCGTEQQL